MGDLCRDIFPPMTVTPQTFGLHGIFCTCSLVLPKRRSRER